MSVRGKVRFTVLLGDWLVSLYHIHVYIMYTPTRLISSMGFSMAKNNHVSYVGDAIAHHQNESNCHLSLVGSTIIYIERTFFHLLIQMNELKVLWSKKSTNDPFIHTLTVLKFI